MCHAIYYWYTKLSRKIEYCWHFFNPSLLLPFDPVFYLEHSIDLGLGLGSNALLNFEVYSHVNTSHHKRKKSENILDITKMDLDMNSLKSLK